MRGCAWDRETGGGKTKSKIRYRKNRALCRATAPTSPRTHVFCPPLLVLSHFYSPALVASVLLSSSAQTHTSSPSPSCLLLLPSFSTSPRLASPTVGTSVCNFDPMYLSSPFPGTHGSCSTRVREKGEEGRRYVCVVRLGTAAKNESQYVHDKIYTQKMSYPPFLSLLEGGKGTERRGRGIMAIPMRRPFDSALWWPLSAQGSAIPMGAPCTRYNLLPHACDLSTR